MRAGRIEQCGTLQELRDAPATPYVAQLLGRAQASAASLAAT
jgi:ABC-type Fe3+/spermidine/putrescine transport system ATPase subunit